MPDVFEDNEGKNNPVVTDQLAYSVANSEASVVNPVGSSTIVHDDITTAPFIDAALGPQFAMEILAGSTSLIPFVTFPFPEQPLPPYRLTFEMDALGIWNPAGTTPTLSQGLFIQMLGAGSGDLRNFAIEGSLGFGAALAANGFRQFDAAGAVVANSNLADKTKWTTAKVFEWELDPLGPETYDMFLRNVTDAGPKLKINQVAPITIANSTPGDTYNRINIIGFRQNSRIRIGDIEAGGVLSTPGGPVVGGDPFL